MAKRNKSPKKIARGQLPCGVCVVAVAPVRRKPSDTEEMVTQLLFGETLEVIVKKHNSWMKIKCRHDNYIGWIDSKQVVRISNEECDAYEQTSVFSMDLAGMVSSSKEAFPILLGSKLPAFDGMHLTIHDEKYLYNGAVTSPISNQEVNEDLFERVVKKFMHAPYLWGGRSIFGIDPPILQTS